MHNLVLDVPRHMPLHPSGKRIIFDYAGEDSVRGFYVAHGLNEMEACAPSRLFAYCRTRGGGGGGGDLIGILTHT
ncbi:cytochrome b5-like protein [Leishmania infantum JPCM5]|uniref:Cytochrome b5-like protein n=1 Tax=Leishmania infantum TaxID=5671 RepID=A4HTA9_LEIIN|nr:cytochrome b5-like protein [Leishmania infantum JPCM5]CAM65657.1 cytochrome b5-like protein [Leishmania infantum JPCM5]|eukprot:XP_001463300.1 cytochrome b5-like protein [Leishmania infantum JPCM5]